MSATVVMYATRFCPFCMRARSLLNSKGVDFQEISVSNDPDLWQTMQTLSGRDTVPQIFINDQAIGGYDDLALLDREGTLDHLLNHSK